MERGLSIGDARDRADAAVFVQRAARIADNAVIRLRRRDAHFVELWATTGFDVLVTRMIGGYVAPADIVCDAATLLENTHTAQRTHAADIDLGFSFDSAWPGALPPIGTFEHIEDVPARAVARLAHDGADVAREESGVLGPAASLLAQNVLTTRRDDGSGQTTVPMRAIFALTAMGFVKTSDGLDIVEATPIEAVDIDEPVRVRASATWGRLDARYGSVAYRRTKDIEIAVV